jgi:hypothetical protein
MERSKDFGSYDAHNSSNTREAAMAAFAKLAVGIIQSAGATGRAPTHDMQQQGHEGLRNMHHFYPRGAFYLACMAVGVVLMLLFYFWSGQVWALWVWLWT